MLDTISHPQVVPGTERFDSRINVRPRPSFGLGSLRSRKWLLAIGTIACLAIAALYIALRPTTYTASSQLLIYIRQILTGPDQAILPGRADVPMVQNQIELLRSGNVLAKVIEGLQLTKDPEFTRDLRSPSEPKQGDSAHPAPEATLESFAYRAALRAMNSKLSVRQVGTSHMVTVSFKASSPEKAARIVNSVIRIYLQERGRASDAASSKAPLREIHQSLGPSAQVVSDAEPPVKADGPPAILILVAAALFGLSAAAAVAILLDMFNDTIRSAHQMEYVLGLECLGVVPRFPSLGVEGEDTAARRLFTSESPVLRRAAAMLQDVSSGGPRTIGVTSVLPNEGATTLAIGLAMAAAAQGKHVLLIDAMPENPSISRWVASLRRLPMRPGASPVSEAFDDIVHMQAGLHVLPLAERSGGEARLMRRGWLDDILGAAETPYDLVIVDMPSLVAGPQVRAAAQSLDGVLLVVKWGATESELVRQAFQSAGQARHKFIGTVLNMADEETMKRYGYEKPTEMKVVMTS
jgi:Mrp family chromosome partitioning ATPase